MVAQSGPIAEIRREIRPLLPLWVKVVIGLCCAIEALLLVSDLLNWRLTFVIAQQPGILSYFTQQRIGVPIRQIVDYLFGFWSAQIHAGHGLYPGQPAAMFATYGFLHAGPIHLGMNMLSLVAIARELNRLIGAARMALVYAVTQVAAALLFALMTPQGGPMIGASGAIFGLAGALIGFAAVTGWRHRRPLGQLWRGVAMMVVLNVALTVLMPSIAWEAHLGGTLAGLVMGAWMAMIRSPRTSAF
ncbi:Rhomboid family protein [Paracoccus haematequi]|uniref:Rhomboid family protein n=1 Tax=Paracoccus haematequi TaxID=2491866 RepID=A0A3S4DAA6_9RHOB|nr:rhomboid family intramembrane serine protease [Paracoccus haematequi]VDS07952.1 Rhomboid family protein [Paracoccus haematequi]